MKSACVAWLELNYRSCCVRPKITAPVPSSGTLLSFAGWSINQEVILAFASRKFPAPVCWECRVCNYTQCSERLLFVPHLHWSTDNLPHSVKQWRFPVLLCCWKRCFFLLRWVNNYRNTSSGAWIELPLETNLVTSVSQYPHYFFIFYSIYSYLLLIVSPKCKLYLYFSLDSREETFCTPSAYGLEITLIFVSLICTSVIKGFH